ncbi:hypothetical protein CL622_01180 [archaeon]|nr:hypothetical protein [archaeon]
MDTDEKSRNFWDRSIKKTKELFSPSRQRTSNVIYPNRFTIASALFIGYFGISNIFEQPKVFDTFKYKDLTFKLSDVPHTKDPDDYLLEIERSVFGPFSSTRLSFYFDPTNDHLEIYGNGHYTDMPASLFPGWFYDGINFDISQDKEINVVSPNETRV